MPPVTILNGGAARDSLASSPAFELLSGNWRVTGGPSALQWQEQTEPGGGCNAAGRGLSRRVSGWGEDGWEEDLEREWWVCTVQCVLNSNLTPIPTAAGLHNGFLLQTSDLPSATGNGQRPPSCSWHALICKGEDGPERGAGRREVA